MSTDVVDDREMREAQRDYLDFLDDDVSPYVIMFKTVLWDEERNHAVETKEIPIIYLVSKKYDIS